jgi:predicted permease
MRRIRAVFFRVLGLMGRRRPEDELDAEIDAHIAMHTADGIRSGLSPEEARRQALLRLGGAEQAKQAWRERKTLPWFDHLLRDARYGLRQLSKSPGFTVAAILTLTLGIGANAAIFSVIEAVLLRPLPYRNADRLVVIWQSDKEHRGTGAWFDSYREFEAWEQSSRSFDKLAALSWARGGAPTMLWHEKPIDVAAMSASADFFDMLGAFAQSGRTFLPSDLENPCTLVLAHPFWEQKLGAPRDIVGQTVKLGDTPCQVVGVMAKSFSFYPAATGAWSLITPASPYAKKPWETMTGAFGVLKPGVSRAAAEAELASIQARVTSGVPPELSMMRTWEPVVLDLKANFTWLAGRNLRSGLWVLMAAAGLVLLMACVNVANLLLGRAQEREREMAVRAALGSGRGRLFSQMLTEALLLALAGAAGGIPLAEALLRWFRAANPVELPPGNAVTLDWRVLLFTAAVGSAAALAFGVLPAWRGSRIDPNATLKGAGPNQGAHGSAQRTSQALVVLQVALSMVLIAGTGLLCESLLNLAETNVGYRLDHLLTAQVRLPETHYPDDKSRLRIADELARRVQALPAVQALALGSDVIPRGGGLFSVQGDSRLASNPGSADELKVSTNYFSTLGIPRLRGRVFDGRDRADTLQVAIVNQALAKKYFGGADPMGRAVKLSRADDASAPWLTVVGVVADVETTTVFKEMGYVVEPTVFRPLAQSPPATLAMVVLADGDPADLTGNLQQQLSSVDRGLLLSGVQTMQAMHAADLAQPRFRTVLAGGFAMLALVLAIVGLYGVLSRLVARRTREIGIRMALGADREKILRSVLRRAAAMAAAGVVCGAAASFFVARLIRNLLYGIQAGGAAELSAVGVAMLLVAVLAAWHPARRAASVDPMQALRAE